MTNTFNSINNDLGECYFKLDNYQKAAFHFIKSNEPNATLNLGILALEQGVLSHNECVEVFGRLINLIPFSGFNNGINAFGFFLIIRMYQNGIGTQQNTNEAYNYTLKSSNMGDKNASEILVRYKKKLLGGYDFV